MTLVFRPAASQAARDAVFFRMRDEGLLTCAMYALATPTLADWQRITAPERGLLLRCEDAQGRLMGCGLFSPWRGHLLEFDFTTFRDTAHLAVPMARQGFAWVFAHLDCSGIVGLCPLPNRHAWRLATACGFRQVARLPAACFYARKGCHVDGLFFVLTRAQHSAPLQ